MKKINGRKIILMLIDALIVLLSSLLSNAILGLASVLIFGTRDAFALNPARIFWIAGLNVVFCFFMLVVFGAYYTSWRNFKKADYLKSAAAVVLGLALGTLFSVLSHHDPSISYVILNTLVTTGALMLFRFFFRKTFIELVDVGREESFERTLIVGAGNAARILLTDIDNASKDQNNPSGHIRPVCLVDDDESKLGTEVMGVEVAGTTKDIPSVCRAYKIDLIIFAIPSCEEEDRKRIMELCSEAGCKIKTLPYLSQILFDDEGDAHQLLQQVKDIKIEDLLGREPIKFDKTKIREFIEGKVCMVTGGGGSIGSELVRQIAKYHPKRVIIVDIYENNAYDIQQELYLEYEDSLDLVTLIASVRDYDKMECIFREYTPDVVFHAAAHKHVPLMEISPAEAVKNNIFGTWNMVNLSEKYNCEKFVMISTDKAVNPTNVMGATKRCCEMIVQYMSQKGSNTEFVTTRFGNVLGSNGSVIPLFRRQIEAGKPVTVTHRDIIRYFMTIPEAVSLVLEAGAIAKGGEIFVLDMGEPVKITTLAENLIRMYGKVPYRDVEIKFTGLRKGEKLYEELLMSEEGLQSTENKKIFIGNQIDVDPDTLLPQLDELKEIANENDNDKTVEKLSEIVDTFHHNEN
ncbi:MAG: polysaccharide biosynthesis protein [Ruminococcus sp.]|nr:polysaccharide biosynthesis protein [Ruminococcus sp.]MBQ6152476.1 polysaccharide biosynthesis protein [Ruminococcus sp.]